jgi:hypothetical protein
MDTENSKPDDGLTPQETAQLLRRILADVDEDKRSRRLDIACAVLLAFATTGSAWCAYQASEWVGRQLFALADDNQSNRSAMMLQLELNHDRIADALLMTSYFEADFHGDTKFAEFLRQRMRPEAKRVIDVWLTSDPSHRADTFPLHPLKSPDYVLPELELVKQKIERSEAQHAVAVVASRSSDAYFRLTVVFSAVLFFAGLGATFKSRPLRWTVLVIAAIALTFGAVKITLLPIAPP